jgi:flavodoxin
MDKFLNNRTKEEDNMENKYNMEKRKKKSAILPIKASHIELVTDEETDKKLKELIKKLNK